MPATGKLGERKSKQKHCQRSCCKNLALSDGGTLHLLDLRSPKFQRARNFRGSNLVLPTSAVLELPNLDVSNGILVDAGCMKIESCWPAASPDLNVFLPGDSVADAPF